MGNKYHVVCWNNRVSKLTTEISVMSALHNQITHDNRKEHELATFHITPDQDEKQAHMIATVLCDKLNLAERVKLDALKMQLERTIHVP